MKKRIYLDNNATTYLDPRVLKILINTLSNDMGNPSSMHSFGQESRRKLMKSRDIIASFLKVKANEIIFTSGGTESLNMVIRGLVGIQFHGHIISSSVEHSAVYATLKKMESCGCDVTFLSPGLWGAVTVDAVRKAIQPDTRFIVLMAANNETGVKTDIASIAALALEKGIPFIVDGVAILGKEFFSIPAGISAMCFSGHKLHAPKGIGFAFVRNGVSLDPLITGGDQEYNKRGGTENLPAIVSLAEAISILKTELPISTTNMAHLRDKLEQGLISQLSNVTINGEGPRVCNTTNLSFEGVEGESLLVNLDLEGIAVSHGSACASGSLEPSRILLNMGIPPKTAQSSVRFSLSRFTTEEEINHSIDIIVKVINRLRMAKVEHR